MPAPNEPDQPIRPPWREPEPPKPTPVGMVRCPECGEVRETYKAACTCEDDDTPLWIEAAT